MLLATIPTYDSDTEAKEKPVQVDSLEELAGFLNIQ
jgi:hypothetical protein